MVAVTYKPHYRDDDLRRRKFSKSAGVYFEICPAFCGF